MQQIVKTIICDFCWLYEQTEIAGTTFVMVIDGVPLLLDLCPDHVKMTFEDTVELFKENGKVVPPPTPGTYPLDDVPSQGKGKKVPKKGQKIGTNRPSLAKCPVEGCTRENLEGFEGETESRGVLHHVRQTQDDAHRAAWAHFSQYRTWK